MELHVKVVEATNVPKMDTVGKTDAYAVLSIRTTQQWKTKVIDNNLHPVWNEIFTLPACNPQADILRVELWDKDVKKDDMIGHVEIPVGGLPKRQPIETWYDIVPAKKVKDGCRIKLTLHLTDPGKTPFKE